MTEIVDGLVIDVDDQGDPVGIDIGRASERFDLSEAETIALPAPPARDRAGTE